MGFMEFQSWLSDSLRSERKFQTLKGRSYFYARYDSQNSVLAIKLSTGYQGKLRDDQIAKIFQRYETGSQSERNMTSFFNNPWWPETPNLILAPYVPAIIRAWIEEKP
jgi:hypothetical protein